MGCPAESILGDNLVFTVCTHDPDTAEVTDADSVPTYRIYEDETATAILNGSMAKLDDDNTTGFYSEIIACTTANGFEVDKSYTIYIEGVVGGVTGAISYGFKCVASSAGPGDYAVTLTIRTTGGTPIPGVSVWVNTTATRSGSVVQTSVTNDSGEVTFNLNYTTYYVYCHLAGYTFANTSITPAAGTTTFTLDIGTAVTSGVDSSYDDSFLSRLIADVREQVDEPTINAKYTDNRIVELAEKAYLHVVGEKNRNAKFPAVAKHTVTIATGTTKYALPHTVGTILGIYTESDGGNKIFYSASSPHNPFGRGVWLEGHTLCLQAGYSWQTGTIITIEHIPIGIARLHNGICTVDADGDTVTLGATPHAGELDTHTQAYAGSILRILQVTGTSPTGNYMQERTITSYDNTTRAATLDVALSPVPAAGAGGYIYYEIAPAIHKGLDHVVSLYVAMHICNVEGNRKRADGILREYQNAMRNVRLTTYYSNIQEAHRWFGDNFDNSRYRSI